MKKPLTIVALLLFTKLSFSQLSISSGISFDINNHDKFKQVPVSVEWTASSGEKLFFIIKAEAGIPLNYYSQDSAYTLNNNLPPAVSLKKQIRGSWFAFSPVLRFKVYTMKNEGLFFIDYYPLALGFQNFRITYKDYNKADYEVMNPDVTGRLNGLITGIGAGYSGKPVLVQFHILSPPLLNNFGRYKRSYHVATPFVITAGYSLAFKKNNRKK